MEVWLENGTFWRLVRKYKIFGKYDVEVWVRYDVDGRAVEARRVVVTPRGISSTSIKVPKYAEELYVEEDRGSAEPLEEWGDLDVYEDEDILIVVPDDDDWPEGW